MTDNSKRLITVKMEIPSMTSTGNLELQLHSDRNNRISRFSDVSRSDPDAGTAKEKKADRDHFFPVVDIDLADGWDGVGVFANYTENDFLYINGQINRERILIGNFVPFGNTLLQHWENSVFVHNLAITMDGFYLRKKVMSAHDLRFVSLSPE